MVDFTYLGRSFDFEEHNGGNPIKKLRSGRFYEKTMLDFIRDLKPQGTIADIGANIGNHAVYFGALTDCDSVVAIEPQPTVFKKLTKNIENNELEDKITTLNIAAGDTKGTCGLYWKAEDRLGGTRTVEGNDTEMNTLDNIIGNQNVSVIKIDVEGHEPNVLLGASDILANQSPHLFVEIWNLNAKKQIDQILKPLGYKPVRVFNSSATYYYKKNHKFPKSIKGLFSFLGYTLSIFRPFRRSS